jgi:hypothetical protein
MLSPERGAALHEYVATLLELGITQHLTDRDVYRTQRAFVQSPRRRLGIHRSQHTLLDELQR